MSSVAAEANEPDPYRAFEVRVDGVTRLSPSFVRVAFGGPDLVDFRGLGNDQRVKLVLPLAGVGLDPFPRSGDWYGRWRLLPAELRNPMRTYTVRALRGAGTPRAEVDIDLVLHADGGPAARWAARATPGDRVLLVGPNRWYDGEVGGAEWNPPPGTQRLLLAGDETALPAIAAILDGLESTAEGMAVLEVPTAADRLEMNRPRGVRVDWCLRDGGPGRALEKSVRSVAAQAVSGEPPAYAWLAGEAGAVTRLRRHLVRDLGMAKRDVTFMGYWKTGVAES